MANGVVHESSIYRLFSKPYNKAYRIDMEKAYKNPTLKPPVEIKKTEFGERLRIARQSAHLSQLELGVAIGVSDRAISSYEQGRTLPPIENLKKIAQKTNYPLRFFVGEPEQLDTIQQLLSSIEKQLREIKKILNPEEDN